MSDNTPETAAAHPPKMADSPDIDGKIVPPQEVPSTATDPDPVYDLVEVAPAAQMFTAPKQKRTQDYITGRFG